jgi:type VI protein secretion system component Hcp
MAVDHSTDVLMMMVLDGQPLKASCQTQFDPLSVEDPNSLVYDFKPGCFFEIQDIDLELTAPTPDAHAGDTSKGGVQLNEISVTRQIDIASMALMRACIGTQGFDSASIVKRRAGGGSAESGQAYLRVDFNGVLITKIDWSDEHVVKEKITFITRGLQMLYRAQLADGTLSTKTQQVEFLVPVKS